MNEAVDGGDGHARVRKHVIPAREWLIGRYEKTFSFISLGYQLELHAGFSLVLSHVRQIVQERRVWPLRHSSFAAAAIVCPSLTRLTASSLNSAVYACLGIFFISSLSKVTSILRHLWKAKFRGKLS